MVFFAGFVMCVMAFGIGANDLANACLMAAEEGAPHSSIGEGAVLSEAKCVWPHGTLRLTSDAISFEPSSGKAPQIFALKDVLSARMLPPVRGQSKGSKADQGHPVLVVHECSRLDTKCCDPAAADVPFAQVAPGKRSTRVPLIHVFSSDLSDPMASRPRAKDEREPMCRDCQRTFGTFSRRSHCRACGGVFCSECCKQRPALPSPAPPPGAVAGQAAEVGARLREKLCGSCFDAASRFLATAGSAGEASACSAGEAAAGEPLDGAAAVPGSLEAFAAAAEAALLAECAGGGGAGAAAAAAAPSNGSPPALPRRVLALINPFSGRGRAAAVWEALAKLLEGAPGLEVEALVTTHAGHARELLGSMERLPDALVLASGDGLVCEAVSWCTSVLLGVGGRGGVTPATRCQR